MPRRITNVVALADVARRVDGHGEPVPGAQVRSNARTRVSRLLRALRDQRLARAAAPVQRTETFAARGARDRQQRDASRRWTSAARACARPGTAG